ncbi:MAG TPA: allantoinase AllB [Candidatus Dormibacteraeota bacterium]|nr:allantoinase AllB [Candidatus Dormibacteraeota bacterium]
MSDLVVRGGSVVTREGVSAADIAVTDGVIAAIGSNLSSAPEEIDVTGLHVMPGGIDAHVHFNEPGHTDWETIADGSAALAAGGYTAFVDMPLNSLPVTTDGESFDEKLKAASASSILDFGLWGGLVPGNVDRLEALKERGVLGFKAFMCPSGLEEFPACEERTLRDGMARIAALGSILLVHAEAPEIVDALSRRAIAEGRTGARDFIRSRPASAELEAISRAIYIAGETGCTIHIVHVSTAQGMRLIREAQTQGVDASGETCPHYLLYTEEDIERLGGLGKCAPPFRTREDREELWALLADGSLPIVVSDHSPSPPELKLGDDFFKLWGGISGCQTTRQLLLAGAHRRSIGVAVIAAATATNVARRFGLARKGEVAVGFDADLWIADLSTESVVRREDLHYKHPFSAHEGQTIRGRTVGTLLRGRPLLAKDGRTLSRAAGRLLRRSI